MDRGEEYKSPESAQRKEENWFVIQDVTISHCLLHFIEFHEVYVHYYKI